MIRIEAVISAKRSEEEKSMTKTQANFIKSKAECGRLIPAGGTI